VIAFEAVLEISARNRQIWPTVRWCNRQPRRSAKRKLITDELERLLEQEARDATGKTWATVIAEALLNQAGMGDMSKADCRRALNETYESFLVAVAGGSILGKATNQHATKGPCVIL